MSNDTSSSKSTGYRGPVKLVWEDGTQIMRPDLDAIAQGTPGALQSSYFVGKTLDDVVSETDIKQFESLKSDEEKYDMIKGMITGVETNPIFKVSDPFVGGEYRELKTILRDLINKGKVWLNPKDGNLFEYTYAVANRMIPYPCHHCSKILFSEEERTRHSYSHMARRI